MPRSSGMASTRLPRKWRRPGSASEGPGSRIPGLAIGYRISGFSDIESGTLGFKTGSRDSGLGCAEPNLQEDSSFSCVFRVGSAGCPTTSLKCCHALRSP